MSPAERELQMSKAAVQKPHLHGAADTKGTYKRRKEANKDGLQVETKSSINKNKSCSKLFLWFPLKWKHFYCSQ